MYPGDPADPDRPGEVPPPLPPDAQAPPVVRRNRNLWIFGAILGVVLLVAGGVYFTGSSGPSDQDQIRQAVDAYTRALNSGDADGANALKCGHMRDKDPTTPEDLKEELDKHGSYTTSIKSIDVDGDHARVRIDITSSKGNDDPQDGMGLLLVREAGSWKLCDR